MEKITWKKIKKIREENKDNPNYPHINWTDSDHLHVKISDFEVDDMTVEEARERFKDNKLFIDELDFLLSGEKRRILIEEPEMKSTVKQYDIKEIENKIEEKITEIIDELQLQKADENDFFTKLINCCLVQKYIVEHNVYNNDIMTEKLNYSTEDLTILDSYNAIVLQNGVCTSNSLMFKKILEKVGVKAEVVALESNDNNAKHASNIVDIDGRYYFFDSTLESTIYHENSIYTNGDIILCCAALGKNEYCQFYTPICVLPDNALDDVKELPKNIADYRLPQDIVNSLISHQTKNKVIK